MSFSAAAAFPGTCRPVFSLLIAPIFRPVVKPRETAVLATLAIVSIFGLVGLGYGAAQTRLVGPALGEGLTEFVLKVPTPVPFCSARLPLPSARSLGAESAARGPSAEGEAIGFAS